VYAHPLFPPADLPIARLPRRLRQYAVDQQWERYTPMDHAVWRFILRRAVSVLASRAHPVYLEGLRRTGISLEQIPRIEEMNRVLSPIGWGAVAVDGFIPPAAFMEFQAHRVLVIAAEIRQLDHLTYTPAPDIIHEAAGHAPIILDPEYSEYLRRFGEVGSLALASRADRELHEAIRRLSLLKEQPGADPAAVAEAERAVADAQASAGEPSEMARLSRLHWWTVEYGLIGDRAAPRLYGAGLLSSLGEAVSCLAPEVVKLPYTLAAQNFPYDITTRQPQLFVTPSFAWLSEVLEAFAETMAFKIGGLEGLRRAVASEAVATAVLSSGLEVSGVFANLVTSGGDQPVYLRTRGPTALAVRGKELPGHGKRGHPDGFGCPVGRLASAGKALEEMTDADLEVRGIRVGRRALLNFESGLLVTGQLERIERREGRIALMRFSDGKVTLGSLSLFNPQQGPFEMGVGARVSSVFAGAADKDAFEEATPAPRSRSAKRVPSAAEGALASLYSRVRAVREGRVPPSEVEAVWRDARRGGGEDWLLALELLELAHARRLAPGLREEIRGEVELRARSSPEVAALVAQRIAELP
jgi:phenylalanine-4-hydroxylase